MRAFPSIAAASQALAGGDSDPIHDALEATSDLAELELVLDALGWTIRLDESLDRWVETRGARSPLPWCVRGSARIAQAWAARGAAFASDVDEGAWPRFFDLMRCAESDLLQASRIAPSSPLPWTWLATTGRGLQIPKDELRARHRRSIIEGGPLPLGAEQTMQGICAKWSGSHDEMFEFARATGRAAPDGSPLHRLVPIAHLEHAMATAADDEAVWESDEARQEIVEAAARSVDHPGLGEGPLAASTLDRFAICAFHFGLEDLAIRCHERIHGRHSAAWAEYFDDPEEAILDHRTRLGLSPP